jgi:hypothetical protein
MGMSTRGRQWITWTLLCALVLAAMAPAVVRAVAVAQGALAPWSVVCSAPPDAPLAPAGDSQHVLSHCAWCNLHLSHLAPPPVAQALHARALAGVLPGLQLPAPRLLSVWAAAQARAPPSLAA